MSYDLAEQLTVQFYCWEILGRGWLLYNGEVELEAPFTPFFGHFPWGDEHPYEDDGIRHTLASRFLSLFKPKASSLPRRDFATVLDYTPIPFEDDDPLIVYKVIIQRGLQSNLQISDGLLSMLSYLTQPMSFEIIGTKDRITLQFTCRESDSGYLRAQMRTHFPNVGMTQAGDALDVLMNEQAIEVVDFGLREEFSRPLQLANKGGDSLTGLYTVLEHLEAGESVVFQVLFNGLVNRWENSIVRSVTGYDGRSFFVNAPDMPNLAKEKVRKPLMATTVRCATLSDSFDTSIDLLRQVAFALKSVYRSGANTLISLHDTEYDLSIRLCDMLLRRSHRLGMLLNTEELSTLVHLPSGPLLTKKVLGRSRKTKLPPIEAQGHDCELGVSEHGGEKVVVTLSDAQRLKHTHIIGATGTGKSTLLTKMIIGDIERGTGLAVLDPHGDLIETVLKYVPEHRATDIVLIDPADSEYPVGFNILKAHTAIEKETLASDLVGAFKRLSTSWGDQMHSVLSNAILAFLESSKGGTPIDLRRFLLETPFRNEFLKSVEDYSVLYYWQKQYPLLKGASIGPILTRLDNFLRSRLIRNMVAQKGSLDFESIINTGKILLVKLSQGLIGQENAYLLGSFIVSKLHQAALARQNKESRRDFYFYIDEFQHFATESMSHILSGARKYHLGLVLAHQDLHQLSRGDTELSTSVLANAGTRICFRVGENDAKKLAEGFSEFDAADLQNLNVGEAIGRVEKQEWDFSFTTEPLIPPTESEEVRDAIIAYSRSHYGTAKEIVEQELQETMRVQPEQDAEKSYRERKSAAFKQTTEIHEVVDNKKPLSGQTQVSTTHVSDQASRELTQEEIAGVTKGLEKKRENSQHRYLQNLIKHLAEDVGYKATIEAPVKGGSGKVDVLLECGKETIACEVSVTTGLEWEIHNIQKCLSAGYTHVVSCVGDEKMRQAMEAKVGERFSPQDASKIKVLVIEQLLSFLESHRSGPLERETTIKGYKVTVSHSVLSADEQQQKKEAVARIVRESLRKKK
jgi:hypothetical protein